MWGGGSRCDVKTHRSRKACFSWSIMDSCAAIWAVERISSHFTPWCSSIACMRIWWPTSLSCKQPADKDMKTLLSTTNCSSIQLSFSIIMNHKSYITHNLWEESFCASRISIKFTLNLITIPPGLILAIWKPGGFDCGTISKTWLWREDHCIYPSLHCIGKRCVYTLCWINFTSCTENTMSWPQITVPKLFLNPDGL